MAWIEAHQTLNNHPKLKRAARLAGVEQVAMIGYLMRLWWWCLDYAQDGIVTPYSPDDIEDAVDWGGAPGVLHKALLDTGFLDVDSHENGEIDVYVHDWHEYAGRLLEKRAANAQRAQTSRSRARSVRATYAQRAGLPTQPNQPTEPIPPTPQTEAAKPNGHGGIDDFSLIETAHASFVGPKMTLTQAKTYEDLLKQTTPAAIIAALQTAHANQAKTPYSYAMKIIKNQEEAGELPRNGPKVVDFTLPQEIEASWM